MRERQSGHSLWQLTCRSRGQFCGCLHQDCWEHLQMVWWGHPQYWYPYDARNITIREASQLKGFCVSMEDGIYTLCRDQVQGQLHLTARQTCYFVEWTTKDSVIIPIAREDNSQSNLLALEYFLRHISFHSWHCNEFVFVVQCTTIQCSA